jgi:tRNA(Arg) A34 adenosine deaminase TadA
MLGCMQGLKPSQTLYFENLAFFLKSRAEVMDSEVALVCHQGRTYFSVVRSQLGPSSAVVKLIQGIFDLHRDHSFFILRNRIWTTEPLGSMNRGMVRLAAKRISQVPAINHGLAIEHEFEEVGSIQDFVYPSRAVLEPFKLEFPLHILSHEEGIRWSLKLARSVPRGTVLHDHNRAIGVIICQEDGSVISAATNGAGINKTLHAEVRAVQDYFLRSGRRLPSGARIYVSLKPCQMCAGMISQSSEDPVSLKIFFAEEDLGPRARATAIDANLIFYRPAEHSFQEN